MKLINNKKSAMSFGFMVLCCAVLIIFLYSQVQNLSASCEKLTTKQQASITKLKDEYITYNKIYEAHKKYLQIQLWLAKNHITWQEKITPSLFWRQIIILTKSFGCNYVGGEVMHTSFNQIASSSRYRLSSTATSSPGHNLTIHYQITGKPKNLAQFLQSFVFLVSEQKIIRIKLSNITGSHFNNSFDFKKENLNNSRAQMMLDIEAYLFSQ